MNCFRFSGSCEPETCSAETVVPRMTKMSTPASTTTLENSAVRCGDSAAAVTTPESRTSLRRCPISSSLMGAA